MSIILLNLFYNSISFRGTVFVHVVIISYFDASKLAFSLLRKNNETKNLTHFKILTFPLKEKQNTQKIRLALPSKLGKLPIQ